MSVLLLFATLSVNSCSTLPERDYTVKLWLLDFEKKCVQRKRDGVIYTVCHGDKEFPDLIGISPEDYVKERNYQDELIKACR
jgi:hypothetical protein